MLRITLEQWRMFHAVVEYGGFNQAAQKVYKSQSSIHTAVSKIEDSLGIKLFVIQGRKTTLTEAGEMILRRSKYLLSEAKKVEDIGTTLSEGIETYLKIAVDEVFPRSVLYAVLEQVSKKFPLVQIEILESILNGSSEMLKSDFVDLAISPKMEGVSSCEDLCSIMFGAVTSPDHPLQKISRPLALEDLKRYRQIVVRDSSGMEKDKRANDGWLEANQRWTVSHMQSSIDMIINGLGFAWLPLSLIEKHLHNGDLKPLNLETGAQRTAQLYLSCKDIDSLGPVAKYFLQTLRVSTSTSL